MLFARFGRRARAFRRAAAAGNAGLAAALKALWARPATKGECTILGFLESPSGRPSRRLPLTALPNHSAPPR